MPSAGKAASVADADAVVNGLKSASSKVEKSQGKAVALKAAEPAYLEAVAKVRDALQGAVKSQDDKDRSKLMEVFGGDCARVAAVRVALEQTTLGELRKDDPRIPQCLLALDTIEQIIREKGMGKALAEAMARAKAGGVAPSPQADVADAELDGTWFTPEGDMVVVKNGEATVDGEKVKLAGDGDAVNLHDPSGKKKKSGKVLAGKKEIAWDDGAKWQKERNPKMEGAWYLPDGSELAVKDGEGTLGGVPVKVSTDPDGQVHIIDKATGKPKKKGKLIAGDKAVDWGDGDQWSRERPKADPNLEGRWYLPDGTEVMVKDGKATVDGKPVKLAGPGGVPPTKAGTVDLYDPSEPGSDPTKTGKLGADGKSIDFGDDKPWNRSKNVKTKSGPAWKDPYDGAPRNIMVELGCEMSPVLDWGDAKNSFKLRIPNAKGKLKTDITPPLPDHPDLKKFEPEKLVDLPDFTEFEILFDPSTNTPEKAQFQKSITVTTEILEIPADIEAKVGSRALQPWGAKKLKEGNDVTELHFDISIEESFALDSDDDKSTLSVTLKYTFDCKLTGAGSAKFQPDGQPVPSPATRK